MHKTDLPIVTNIDFEKFDNLTVHYVYEVLQFMELFTGNIVIFLLQYLSSSIIWMQWILHTSLHRILENSFIFLIYERNWCEVLEWAIFGSFIVIFHYWYQKDLTSITDSFFVCTIQSITKQRFSIIAGDCTFSKKGTHISILLEIQDHLI